MTEKISPRTFHEAGGVDDWRALAHGACAHFRTGSFASGVALVNVIGRLADAANHHPEVDLRYSSVTVRLWTHDVKGLSLLDVDLARKISLAASDLGIVADPSGAQDVQISIDVLDAAKVTAFWEAVLDYSQVGDDDVIDLRFRGPSLTLREIRDPGTQRSRIRVDVVVAHDRAEPRVAAALAAGGRLLSDEDAPSSWILADAEGNEARIASWIGREQ